MKKKHSSNFKAKVAMDAIKETATMSELSSKHGVHRLQIQKWKKFGIENFETLFSNTPDKTLKEKDNLISRLYEQIGQLKVEADWLKKKLNITD